MDMIMRRRRGGKTQACIDWARDTDGTIMVAHAGMADQLQHRAPGVRVRLASSTVARMNREPYVVDELDDVLRSLLGHPPEFATLTPDWLRMETSPLWRPARDENVDAAVEDIAQWL